MSETATRDRFRGSLLGLAAGDALGTTLEFKRPGSFEPIVDMVGGGPHRLQPGQWTDDTSMALCLATSLVECGGFDAADQMQRYVRWWRDGYLSATGSCFDIGNTVSAALSRFIEHGDPYRSPAPPTERRRFQPPGGKALMAAVDLVVPTVLLTRPPGDPFRESPSCSCMPRVILSFPADRHRPSVVHWRGFSWRAVGERSLRRSPHFWTSGIRSSEVGAQENQQRPGDCFRSTREIG